MKRKFILIGPPAAGKGTIANQLKEDLSLPHISLGAIFRKQMEDATELGDVVRSYVSRGELVPDDVVIRVISDRLAVRDCVSGFILDGFPRTLKQAHLLEDLLKKRNITLDAVISIDVSDEEAIRRSSSRRHCKLCNEQYNLIVKPPKAHTCDVCQGELIMREDDKEGIIIKRLQEYHALTEPILEYYKNKNLVKIFSDSIQSQLYENIKRFLMQNKYKKER